MPRRPALLRFSVRWLATALLVAACGSSDETASPADPDAEDSANGAGGSQNGADTDSTQGGDGVVQVALEGEPAPLDGGARLEVRELNPVVNLVVTAVYSSNHDNLVQLQLALDGVQNAVGSHHSELGAVSARAFAVAYLDRVSYTSRSGNLDVTLDGNGALSGSFVASLAEDPAPGAQPAVPSEPTLELSGSFEGSWSLLCRSPVIGLPGDHSVMDSAYCKRLAF